MYRLNILMYRYVRVFNNYLDLYLLMNVVTVFVTIFKPNETPFGLKFGIS